MLQMQRTGINVCREYSSIYNLNVFLFDYIEFYYADNPNTYKGPPVGLQIVGRKYEEEKVIEMMKVIEASMSLIQ